MIDDLFDEINELIEEKLKTWRTATAEELGYDPRAYHGKIYVSPEAIVVKGIGGMDYYGGMEYVKNNDRKTIGDYTFYLAEDNNRVRRHLSKVFPHVKPYEDD